MIKDKLTEDLMNGNLWELKEEVNKELIDAVKSELNKSVSGMDSSVKSMGFGSNFRLMIEGKSIDLNSFQSKSLESVFSKNGASLSDVMVEKGSFGVKLVLTGKKK